MRSDAEIQDQITILSDALPGLDGEKRAVCLAMISVLKWTRGDR